MDSNQIVNAEDALDNFPRHEGNGPFVNDLDHSPHETIVVKPTFKFI